MKPENEGTKINVGSMGIGFGLDYYHSKDQFIHFGYSALFGGADRTWVEATETERSHRIIESMTTEYISLSNNHKFGQFSIGYGLSFAHNKWDYKRRRWLWVFFIPVPVLLEHRVEQHNAFGFVFPMHLQVGEYFNVGAVYRPTFLRTTATHKLAYEHLLSLEFAWKIRVKK